MLKKACKDCEHCEGIGKGEYYCHYFESNISQVADWKWDYDEHFCDKFTDKKEIDNLQKLWGEE